MSIEFEKNMNTKESCGLIGGSSMKTFSFQIPSTFNYRNITQKKKKRSMNCLLCYLFPIFITSNDLQTNSNSLKNKRIKHSLMTRLKPLELGSYFKHNINQSKTFSK